MTDSETDRLRHRRQRDLAIQGVIDELVRLHGGSPPDEIRRRLVEGVTARGISGLPEPFLDAVATEVSSGNPYVVSSFTLEEADVPRPERPVPDEVID